MSDPAISDEVHLRLIEEAARYRDRAHCGTSVPAASHWKCDRGHSWDAPQDAARNVRCMNCAARRRELETKRLRELADVRGGALLSPGYVDAATPLTWMCAYGHVWDARPDAASRRWCAACARNVFASYR
jgi:hypothetical protein